MPKKIKTKKKIKYEYWNGPEKKDDETTYYKYDANGNIISKIIDSLLRDGSGSQQIKTTYKYDINNNIIEMIEHLGEELYDKTLYKYDKNNNLIEEKSNSSIRKHKYSKGKKIETRVYDRDSSINTKIEIKHYCWEMKYDLNGNLINSVNHFVNEVGQKDKQCEYVYEYDQKNNNIKKTRTLFSESIMEELLTQVFKPADYYDDPNEKPDDVDIVITKYEYDNSNNLVKEIEGEDFINYKYDSENNKIESQKSYNEKFLFFFSKRKVIEKTFYTYEYF